MNQRDPPARSTRQVAWSARHGDAGCGAERGCLSLCVWTDRERARRALALPRHRAATTLARQSYEWFHLERYRLSKLADGRVVAEVWHEAESQRDVA